MKKIMLATALLPSSLFGADDWKIEPLTNPYFMVSEDMKEDITAYCGNYAYQDSSNYTPFIKLTFTALTYPDSKLANEYLPKGAIDAMKNRYVALTLEGNVTNPNDRFGEAAQATFDYFMLLGKDDFNDVALRFYNDANRACNAKYYKKDIGVYRLIDKETLIKGEISESKAFCPKEGASMENYIAPFFTILGVAVRIPKHSAASFFNPAILYRIQADYAKKCSYNQKISKDACMDEVIATALPDIINYYNKKEDDGFLKLCLQVHNDTAQYCNEKLKTDKYKTITLEEMKRAEAEGENK